MISVLFYFTDYDPTFGLGSPKNYIQEWIYNAIVFSVDKIIMIDNTELKTGKYYKHYSSEIEFVYCENIEEAINKFDSSTKWIFLESESAILEKGINQPKDLQNYVHPPENAVYVFGPDFSSSDNYGIHLNHDWVFFKTCKNKPLYALPSSTIVLYDRHLKNLKND